MKEFTFLSTLLMVTIWFSTSKANKFDFPRHLVGNNVSALDDLQSYMKYTQVDLGLDIFDDHIPMHIRKALVEVELSDDYNVNQYRSVAGYPKFLKAVSDFYSPLVGRQIIPDEEMYAPIGATGGLFNAIHGHTSPGDEWIFIQPAYSIYVPTLVMALGIPKYTFLKLNNTGKKISSQDWILDREQMESLFTERTKGIFINNPLNPLGKVYTREELEFIAGLAKKYNTLVVSDEAHEWLAFDKHVRIASLPGMWERTITIGSSSKTFQAGGFRVSWSYGSAHIIKNCKLIHERAATASPTPMQAAMAIGFEQEFRDFGKPESYFFVRNREAQAKRDFLLDILEKAGFNVIVPAGGFCISVDWTPFMNRVVKDETTAKSQFKGIEFPMWFVKETGVLGFPNSFYYGDGNRASGTNYTRFCYNRSFKTLRTAKRLILAWLSKSGNQANAEQVGNQANEEQSANQVNVEQPTDQENAEQPPVFKIRLPNPIIPL